MNLYFLLEGRSTEPKLYRAWLRTAFPQLREVFNPAAATDDNFLLISGHGQPAIFGMLDATIQDLCEYKAWDHLFICLDAEEDTHADKLREVALVVEESAARHRQRQRTPDLQIHTIVQNCCIETWFLGNPTIVRPRAQDPQLRQWQEFYDVRTQDPELLPAHADYPVRAQFHHAYLQRVLQDRNPRLHYNKRTPGPVLDPSYMAALIRRVHDTGHLPSLGVLLDVWRSLGAQLPDRSP